jgi:hypothetical protein
MKLGIYSICAWQQGKMDFIAWNIVTTVYQLSTDQSPCALHTHYRRPKKYGFENKQKGNRWPESKMTEDCAFSQTQHSWRATAFTCAQILIEGYLILKLRPLFAELPIQQCFEFSLNGTWRFSEDVLRTFTCFSADSKKNVTWGQKACVDFIQSSDLFTRYQHLAKD